MGVKGLTGFLKTHFPVTIRDDNIRDFKGRTFAVDISVLSIAMLAHWEKTFICIFPFDKFFRRVWDKCNLDFRWKTYE